jgi:hypothetical protein
MTPGKGQAWKSHSRFPHPQPSGYYEVDDFLPGLLANHEMAQRSNPALLKPVTGRSLPRLPSYLGRGRSAFHQGQGFALQRRPYTFAQTHLSLSFFACDTTADHTFRLVKTVVEQGN